MRKFFSKLKKFFIFSILAIFLANLFLGYAKAQAPPSGPAGTPEPGHTKSAFEAKPDGTLIHTYYFNGQKKRKTFFGQKTVGTLEVFPLIGQNVWKSCYVYTLKDSPIWEWGKVPYQSLFFLIIYKDPKDKRYETQGIYFIDSTKINFKDNTYIRARYWERMGAKGDFLEAERKYEGKYGKEFADYISYVNNKEYPNGFTVSGLTVEEETANAISIEGNVDVDYTNSLYIKDKTGIEKNLPKKGIAQLWYKSKSAQTYLSIETIEVDEQGSYKFKKRKYELGIYRVSLLFITDGKTWEVFMTDSLEEYKKTVSIPESLYVRFKAKEGFFGASEEIELKKDSPSSVKADFTIKSIGIKVERPAEIDIGGGESECEKSVHAAIKGIGVTAMIKRALASLGCMFLDMAGKFVEWAIKSLNKAAGISQNLFIERVYAQGTRSLSLQLKSPEITGAWRISLAITDIIVIFALLTMAFANILKLNIDVYAVKKALPGLLIGVILANFSLLICRVFVDFASLLSSHFLDMAGGEGNIGAKLSALIFHAQPEVIGGIGGVAVAASLGGLLLLLFGLAGGPLFCLAFPLIFLFLLIPAFIIWALAFLLYARIYVVWILVILSPLAFVILGFPPAQQYFKTWWSWFLKWVFLAPIAYFFLAIAAKLGEIVWLGEAIQPPEAPGGVTENLSWFGGWILGMIVLVMAIYLPFKLGGAITKLWMEKVGKPLGMAADAMIGRITGGYSPLGLYHAVKETGARSWRKHIETAKGKALPLTETVAATPRAIGAMIKQRRFGAGGDILRGTAEEAKAREATRKIQQWRQEYMLPYHGEELANRVRGLIDAGEYEMATAGLTQASEEGIAEGEEGERIMNELYRSYGTRFAGRPEAASAINIAQNTSINSPYGPFVSPITIEGGRVVEKAERYGDERLLKEMRDLLNRSLRNLRPSEQERVVEHMTQRIMPKFQKAEFQSPDLASLHEIARRVQTMRPEFAESVRDRLLNIPELRNLLEGAQQNTFHWRIYDELTRPRTP